ncbi:MAG: DMT family transporter [Bacteroidales bacterium]|nr:DMT family transporter [Candidatus Cryptobacteroides caccocaballi]
MDASVRRRTLLGLHIAVLLAGATGLFGRYISISGIPLVWFRMMVGIVAMGIAMACMHKLHKVPFRSLLPISACGVMLAIHWVAFFASIQESNVSVGVACIATSCFFTSVFDPLINRRKFSFAAFAISFISIAGALVIFSLDIRYRTGILLGLASAALYSLFSIMNIRAGAKTGEDSSTMLFHELISGFLFLSICVPVYSWIAPDAPIMPKVNDLIALIILGSVLTVIPFLLQIIAMRRLSAFTVNVTYNLEPVYSIILAAILFGETKELNLSFWTGLALIVLSVVLQTIRSGRK